MRNRTNIWFETKVRYDKTMEDGRDKKVTEQYVVEALSFSEAERRITEEMSHYVSGEFGVKAIKLATYSEAKLAFITLDEKTDKEKRTPVTYLVQAVSLDKARAYVKEVMEKTLIDYDVVSISETHCIDVFEHNNQ